MRRSNARTGESRHSSVPINPSIVGAVRQGAASMALGSSAPEPYAEKPRKRSRATRIRGDVLTVLASCECVGHYSRNTRAEPAEFQDRRPPAGQTAAIHCDGSADRVRVDAWSECEALGARSEK